MQTPMLFGVGTAHMLTALATFTEELFAKRVSCFAAVLSRTDLFTLLVSQFWLIFGHGLQRLTFCFWTLAQLGQALGTPSLRPTFGSTDLSCPVSWNPIRH